MREIWGLACKSRNSSWSGAGNSEFGMRIATFQNAVFSIIPAHGLGGPDKLMPKSQFPALPQPGFRDLHAKALIFRNRFSVRQACSCQARQASLLPCTKVKEIRLNLPSRAERKAPQQSQDLGRARACCRGRPCSRAGNRDRARDRLSHPLISGTSWELLQVGNLGICIRA